MRGELADGLRDVLDDLCRPGVPDGEHQHGLAEATDDGRIALGLLDLVIQGVQDRSGPVESALTGHQPTRSTVKVYSHLSMT